jgi:WD40 repeat protein
LIQRNAGRETPGLHCGFSGSELYSIETSVTNHTDESICPTCARLLRTGGNCLHCAMAGALDAYDEAKSDPSFSQFRSEAETSPGFASLAHASMAGRFAHFEIKREVASGGMGTVYEAEDTKLRRIVALKMIRAFAFSTSSEKARFTAEAGAAAALDHPNIVPIYEVGEFGGQPFFTMKLIEGGTLATRLRDGAMPLRDAVVMMIAVARAVAHAHSRGVLHRDLKPGNILLDGEGKPWLTDFGLAKLTDHESGLTVTNAQLGTPHYMSPEQAAGRVREISTASDVWALGVMLYQMLSGRLPFVGESNGEILRQVMDCEAAALTIDDPRIATSDSVPPARLPVANQRAKIITEPDIATLVARCLEKDAARRLPGAAFLAEELERWSRGEPIRSRRVTTGERVWKWMRRHPMRVAATAALLVSLLAGTIVSTVQWRKAVNHAEAERRSAYAATLGTALAARTRGDLGLARRLLDGISPELRQFDWRLLHGLCEGDEHQAFLLGKETPPECLAWLPSGDKLAVISADGRIHFRDAQGVETAPPRALPIRPAALDTASARPVHHSFSFSPDGRRFVVAWGNLLRVLDAQSLAVQYEETLTMPDAVWLDADRVLLGGDAGVNQLRGDQGAWIYDLRDKSRTPLPSGLSAPLALSGNRRFVALSRISKTERQVEIFTVDTMLTAPPERTVRLGHDAEGVPSMLYLTNHGTMLIAVSGAWLRPSLTLEAFERSSGRKLFLQDFKFPITGMAVHPTQTLVAVTGEDAMLRIYDFQRDDRVKLARATNQRGTYDDGGYPSIRQPLDGNGANAAPRELLTRSALDGGVRFLMGHEDRSTAVTFASTNDTLFSTSTDGTLRRWSIGIARPGVRIGPVQSFYFGLQSAASPDGQRILFNDADRDARFLDLTTGGTCKLPAWHCPLAVLGDGRFLTQHGGTGAVHCWELARKEPRELWSVPGKSTVEYGWTRRGVVARDGRTVVGAMAGILFVVDVEKRTFTAGGPFEFQLGVHGVSSHDVSADGKWIAATGFAHRATIHRVAEPGKIVATLGGLDDGRDYDTAVAFHPSEPLVYVGNEDGRIRVWENTGDVWRPRPDLGWHAHRGAVTALAVGSDGVLIATSGDDTLKLVSALPEPGIVGRRERLSFTLYHPANWLHFARDASGRDTALLHSSPWRSVESWPVK